MANPNMLRKQILALCYRSQSGHISSALSCVEILLAIYFYKYQESDRVILSKGHAASALYVVLDAKGLLPEAELESFLRDGTHLTAHPPCRGKFAAIPFGTGSLGHGLALANGFALAHKFKQRMQNHQQAQQLAEKLFTPTPKTFCILSDGDCNEGSTWEAALFASQHQLNQLYVVIDYNQLQGLGDSKQILGLDSLAAKWQSFGFEVELCDGHNLDQLKQSFAKFNNNKAPKCLIANTTKGKGVSFMEHDFTWHYKTLSEELYQQAIAELSP